MADLPWRASTAQNRKTAAELIQRFPRIAAALRRGDLCLSSVNELAKVITPGNAAEVLPRFHGKSARDAAVVAAAIRPVENPPERFTVTPVRGAVPVPAAAAASGLPLHTHEVAPPRVATARSAPAAPVPPPSTHPTIRPLDAERARMNVTVSRRLLDKLAAARDALSTPTRAPPRRRSWRSASTSSSTATASGAGSG